MKRNEEGKLVFDENERKRVEEVFEILTEVQHPNNEGYDDRYENREAEICASLGIPYFRDPYPEQTLTPETRQFDEKISITIDDEAENIEIKGHYFEGFGYEVSASIDGIDVAVFTDVDYGMSFPEKDLSKFEEAIQQGINNLLDYAKEPAKIEYCGRELEVDGDKLFAFVSDPIKNPKKESITTVENAQYFAETTAEAEFSESLSKAIAREITLANEESAMKFNELQIEQLLKACKENPDEKIFRSMQISYAGTEVYTATVSAEKDGEDIKVKLFNEEVGRFADGLEAVADDKTVKDITREVEQSFEKMYENSRNGKELYIDNALVVSEDTFVKAVKEFSPNKEDYSATDSKEDIIKAELAKNADGFDDKFILQLYEMEKEQNSQLVFKVDPLFQRNENVISQLYDKQNDIEATVRSMKYLLREFQDLEESGQFGIGEVSRTIHLEGDDTPIKLRLENINNELGDTIMIAEYGDEKMQVFGVEGEQLFTDGIRDEGKVEKCFNEEAVKTICDTIKASVEMAKEGITINNEKGDMLTVSVDSFMKALDENLDYNEHSAIDTNVEIIANLFDKNPDGFSVDFFSEVSDMALNLGDSKYNYEKFENENDKDKIGVDLD